MSRPSSEWTLQRDRVSLPVQKSNAARSLRIWQPQKIEMLRFYIEAGLHGFKEIGEIMGITKDAAIGKAHRLGITGPRSTGPKDAGPTTLFSRLDALHAAFDAARVPDPPRLKPVKQTDNATTADQRGRL